jgi:hypothetical protein
LSPRSGPFPRFAILMAATVPPSFPGPLGQSGYLMGFP